MSKLSMVTLGQQVCIENLTNMTTIENLVISTWSKVGTFIKSLFENKKTLDL